MVNINFTLLGFLCFLAGFGVGGFLAICRLYGALDTMTRVEKMLTQFKSEGKDNKWLR